MFFRYTYNAPDPDGVTHCGIYVGDGMMIHCGGPISYANLKELEQKHHEAENEEIVDIVRGMSMSLSDLPSLLQSMKGGPLGQSVLKEAPEKEGESE